MVLAVLSIMASWHSLLQAAQVRQDIHETYALTPTGTIRIENVNGRIQITGWNRSEVKFDAVKKGRSEQDLEKVNLEIDAQPDRLSVRTKYVEDNSRWFNFGRPKSVPASVDYTLMVPLAARLDNVATVNGSLVIENVVGVVKASSVNGGVIVKGLASPSKLTTVNGSIEAHYDRLDTPGPSTLETVNGSILLYLPEKIDAEVMASTVNGSVSTDLPLAVIKNRPVGKDLKGTLGDGGSRFRVHTVNGAARIRKTALRPAQPTVPVER
jgi:DUF4097 and DUF4098 domain-containing protein YvlB